MTGVLLAGGKSQRMGRDKRFLELDGRTLLDRSLSALETVFSDVLLVVAEPMPQLVGTPHRIVTDLVPNRATLGGLYTGLTAATHPRIFAAACDMPFLAPGVIARLAQLGQGFDLVLVQLASGPQPMHAIYSKACLPHIERMLSMQNLKVQDLGQAPGLSVRLVSEEEVREVDAQLLSFLNINTPADLEFARKLLTGRRGNQA
jgi:molybdopterin-guanine dinucleotide biosynthesis protein A